MAISSVQAIGAAAAKVNTTSLSILVSPGKTITVGNDIFVQVTYNTSTSTGVFSATDPLGNTYTEVAAANGALSSFALRTALLRSRIGFGGTLTAINVVGPSGTAQAAMAHEFSGIASGAPVNTGSWASASSGTNENAYPGTNATTTRAQVAGNLWVGAFGWRNEAGTFTVPYPASSGVAGTKSATQQGSAGGSGGSNASGCLVYFICNAATSNMLNGQTSTSQVFADAGAEFAPAGAPPAGPSVAQLSGFMPFLL